MNTPTKNTMTLEHHQLVLPYEHIRLHSCNELERLTTSIKQQGQLVPVIVVPHSSQQWILIDGYLRLKALQRLGADILEVESWNCEPVAAWLLLLKNAASRPWEAFEEALLLRELHLVHGLSQRAIAHSIGRDKSWVSRRLALVAHMPDGFLRAVSDGTLSLWAATRILTPLARANPSHAESLLAYLCGHHHGTRELADFYSHYQRANKPARQKMVSQPHLFFASQHYLKNKAAAKRLAAGPEGQWYKELAIVKSILGKCIPLASQVFYSRQSQEQCQRLFHAFTQAKNQWEHLTQKIRSLLHDYPKHSPDDYSPAPTRQQQTSDQPLIEAVAQHRLQGTLPRSSDSNTTSHPCP